MATAKLMTAHDLTLIDDEGYRYNLIRGALESMAASSGRHGEIAGEFAAHLGSYLLQHRVGRLYVAEAGFVLAHNPDTLLCPDVAFVRADRLPPDHERDRFLELAPDLVVEVISPSDRSGRINDKLAAYLAGGALYVLLLHPVSRTVTVHTPTAPPRTLSADDIFTAVDLLPGFQVKIADLFI